MAQPELPAGGIDVDTPASTDVDIHTLLSQPLGEGFGASVVRSPKRQGSNRIVPNQVHIATKSSRQLRQSVSLDGRVVHIRQQRIFQRHFAIAGMIKLFGGGQDFTDQS